MWQPKNIRSWLRIDGRCRKQYRLPCLERNGKLKRETFARTFGLREGDFSSSLAIPFFILYAAGGIFWDRTAMFGRAARG